MQLWTPLYSKVPQLHAVGNREIELGDISAQINYTSTTFEYPTNYPFQTYSARFPAPVRSRSRSMPVLAICRYQKSNMRMAVIPGKIWCLIDGRCSVLTMALVQGTTSHFGNIDKNLWYSTVIGGRIKLITLCSYAPFESGEYVSDNERTCVLCA